MGIPGDVVAELEEIVGQEQAMRRRSYELVVAPVLLDAPAGPRERRG
jgi:hypothetical protein